MGRTPSEDGDTAYRESEEDHPEWRVGSWGREGVGLPEMGSQWGEGHRGGGPPRSRGHRSSHLEWGGVTVGQRIGEGGLRKEGDSGRVGTGHLTDDSQKSTRT